MTFSPAAVSRPRAPVSQTSELIECGASSGDLMPRFLKLHYMLSTHVGKVWFLEKTNKQTPLKHLKPKY